VEASAIEVRLRNHDARLESHHNALGDLRSASSRHETEIKVTGTEVREIREDIGEMKREFAKGREEQKEERVLLRRTFIAAASTFAMFIVALATLILQAGG
jgi:septal ring factor EnvC (AmiA/AmiB activator)